MVVDVRSTRSLVRNLCPVDTALVRLLLGEEADLSFLGDLMEDEMARAIVAGELNPRTLMPYDCVAACDDVRSGVPLRDEILHRDFWRVAPSHAVQSELQDVLIAPPTKHRSSAASHSQKLEMIKSRRMGLLGLGLSVESLHKKRKITAESYQVPPMDAPTDPTAPLPLEPTALEYVPRFSSLRPQCRRDEGFWDRLLLSGNGITHDA